MIIFLSYSFRPGRSCEHVLLDEQKSIFEFAIYRQILLALLIDFTKTFDMVDHSYIFYLLRWREQYGIRGLAHKWMESYLIGRKRFVLAPGIYSLTLNMNFGVPTTILHCILYYERPFKPFIRPYQVFSSVAFHYTPVHTATIPSIYRTCRLAFELHIHALKPSGRFNNLSLSLLLQFKIFGQNLLPDSSIRCMRASKGILHTRSLFAPVW